MLSNIKIKKVQELVADLSRDEIIWLNGYLAGIVSKEAAAEVTPVVSAVSKITIAYGTETGNSKKLATAFAAKAKQAKIQAKIIALEQYKLPDLLKEEWLVAIISTHGEGEPPTAAKKFYDHIHENDLSLTQLKYGVLALGDTSYPLFCKAGDDIDQQLQKLGATPIIPIQRLDTDYDTEATDWFSSLLSSLTTSVPSEVPLTAPVRKSGKQIYNGSILTKINLNATGSQKETYHIEIGAQDVAFEPGDALGVVPANNKETVEKIVALSGLDAGAIINYKSEEYVVDELLKRKLSIFNLSEKQVSQYGEIVQQSIPPTRMDLLDLLRIYPVNSSEQFIALLQLLHPTVPRLYSIASSPAMHEGEVHLTVGRHSFQINGQDRNGLCSDYLAQLEEGSAIDFYIHKNHLFKLPAADKDIIMIGPGTGIAPFRSFVAERDATGAEGRSWLFFGDQHFTTDFLYQTEWQAWLETGALSKMNVAFSRDTKEKIYVQHKLLQHAKEVFEWIDGGAYLYICGAKDPMAIDVENTLFQIIRRYKNGSEEEAVLYLEGMKEEGRFLKDVY
ncbi:MAG: sulfite reductase [Flavisolibacter sp.]|nr:sulfite reductase [Flavisolibacter sp.]